MLPNVKITFTNGALGAVAPSADGVAGMLVSSDDSVIKINQSYTLYGMKDMLSLGITSAAEDSNAHIYKAVKEFYDQAGDGAELWLYGVEQTASIKDIVRSDLGYLDNFAQAANGRLRVVGVVYKLPEEYSPDTSSGLDGDVLSAISNAQTAAENITTTLQAPLFVVLPGLAYGSAPNAATPDLNALNKDRVCVLVGDTVPGQNAAVGVLLGRVAASPVQRHIGRVRDGALTVENIYINNAKIDNSTTQTLDTNGFITFRTFVGKSGYFFNDDHLCTVIEDDYHAIARRRTIDKAYRTAYNALLNYVNEEIPVTSNGGIVPAVARDIESNIMAAIASSMTANGELGTDPTDSSDMGVKCYINENQNILSTNQLRVVLQVKPYGYAKYIEVALGFTTIQN